MTDVRYVTADHEPGEDERYRLYRLCACDACLDSPGKETDGSRCHACRGEARIKELVATATDPESVGVALVTLGQEGEWDDCPIGILDTEGETGKKWLVRPWLPSARNVSDAGRTLQQARKGKT